LIFKVCNNSKNKRLERKQIVHFPRRTSITKKRKSNHQYQTINEKPQPKLSMMVRTQQTKESLNINENCSFETTIN
jgi:hypothetical protein